MGRYYSGDIEGKFWFGVQSSTDASFFGGNECEPGYIEYEFTREDDWESVIEGIAECERQLGQWKAKLDGFFEKNHMYNDKTLEEATGMPSGEINGILEWYARLHLGEKIRDCLERQEHCSFQADV